MLQSVKKKLGGDSSKPAASGGAAGLYDGMTLKVPQRPRPR